ncbi:MAG TPA: DUF5681 domain-containing protein [Terriglobales bacterium]|nr:DUF5681 domain-containing protein [Terriglobales bacterium]
MDNDDVGYGRPPKHSRLKKGQSGNPKGRPKGSLNLANVLARELRERVVITENGRRKTITKLEAAVKQIVNKSAASSDVNAFKVLCALIAAAEEKVQTDAVQDKRKLKETDQKILADVLKRFGNHNHDTKTEEK